MGKFLTAAAFLTKIPIPKKAQINNAPLSDSTAFFPVVGLLLGIILVLAACLLEGLLPVRITNLILVLLLTLLTGALHIDGLADAADGFYAGGSDKNRILEIMKDPKIGTMGVLAIAALLLLKFELLNSVSASLRNAALILMCVSSRWSQVMVSYFSKYARAEGGTGKPFVGMVRKKQFIAATIFFALVSLAVWNVKGFLILIATPAASYCMIRYSHRRIGGVTGDVIGAISEINEVILLLIMVILG
ncbi:MAG: adenosylcobinamide-GDP ribazoletransferase [Candidatus Omnitrophota bacterium]